MKNNLVVGAGFSGATIANLLASILDENVTVIDKRGHIGGNCYDYRDNNGIMIHKYGSHIFHTNNKIVWKYISQFGSFNQFMLRVFAYIDGIYTTIPFNFNTLYDVFPYTLALKLEEKLLKKFEYNKKISILDFLKQGDSDLKFLSEYIYEKIYFNYTKKQWDYNPNELDKSVTSRVPIYLSKDNRYFQDTYQGIPIEGYTKLISNMLNHPNIELKLNTEYADSRNNECYERIFYTGSIDEYFNYVIGILPYRSLRFEIEVHNIEYYQGNAIVNYPCNYDFTRIHEYKYYLNDKSEKTVIAKEYPEEFVPGTNDRYYPIMKTENIALYNSYLKMAKKNPNLYFLGRLGDYSYYNIDQSILRAIELFENISTKKLFK